MKKEKSLEETLTFIIILVFIILAFILGCFFGAYIKGRKYEEVKIVSANELLDMSYDRIDIYYNNSKVRVTDCLVESCVEGSTQPFIETNVGSVFFEDSEDAYKVREGETFTFEGRLDIDNDGDIIFHDSDFISLGGK